MITPSTRTLIEDIRDDLSIELLPLADSLELIAQSMDAEFADHGKVPAALASAYRSTHSALIAAVIAARQSRAAAEEAARSAADRAADDALFTPGGRP